MFKNLKHTLITALLCLATANAATVAVLEVTLSSDDEMDLTVEETKFVTDELRRQATQLLPKDYSVPTREKIISITQEKSENLTTVIDIGRAIESDYVTRGFIGKVGNLFTVTVELYETASGNLLGDFIKEASDLKGLLDAIRDNAPRLFAKISPSPVKLETASEPLPTAIPANISAEPKGTKTSFWVAIGLDVLGATAVGLGIYSNAKAGGYYRESQSLAENVTLEQYAKSESEFGDKYGKMQSAKTARNIFYAAGCALLLGGIAVHIWF